MFLDLLNLSAITIALPTIQKEFDVAVGNLQWVISAYALTVSRADLFVDGRLTSLSSLEGFCSLVDVVEICSGNKIRDKRCVVFFLWLILYGLAIDACYYLDFASLLYSVLSVRLHQPF